MTIVRKDSLTSGHKASCGCIHSKGESKIEEILQKEKITYNREFTFDDLLDKDKLRFDFALFKNKALIGLLEYQGIQHFETSGGWNNKAHLDITQYHDRLKQEYCEKNTIPFLKITYKNNINNKMEEILNELFSE